MPGHWGARLLVTGVNWSPGIGNPFKRIGSYGDGLDAILAQQRSGPDEPVIVFLHLAHPRVEYTDRGKSAISFTTINPRSIAGLIEAVTAKWAKQRKAEERHASARLRREVALASHREKRITAKQAASEVMEAAYLKASANDTLPAKARQIMYAARGAIQDRTGKPLDDKYFTQTLLPDFMAENPERTAGWKVVFDARGHLIEPHTGRSLPLGTLEVDGYLRSLGDPHWSDPAASTSPVWTSGPSGRYGAVLFCEKEGFNDLFAAVHLAERYDLAIMSTKGVSVTAARRLVDEICARYHIPLLVLHDFDKSGRRQREALQSGRVQAIGPAGQQHPVAGLDPRRQGVSEPAQQQVTGINGHPLAGIGARHLVKIPSSNRNAVPAVRCARRSEPVRPSGGEPSIH